MLLQAYEFRALTTQRLKKIPRSGNRREQMKPADEPGNTCKGGKRKFAAMASTYCFGVFNDNFFKQAAMLLAVTVGLSHLQGIATLLFAAPFILFSSIAGWVADRFSKKNVVIASKGVELCAMLIGAAGLVTGSWACILAMVFLMGLQSAFFSPALNGSIPELYPESQVPKANGLVKLLTTLAVLAGIACAGMCLEMGDRMDVPANSGVLLAAGVAVAVSLIGFLTSLGTGSRPAAGTTTPFPKFGPVSSIRDTIEISRDRQLLLAIIADGCFYFMASMVVLAVNVLGIEELGMSEMATSMLSIAMMTGICVGSMVVSRLVDMTQWSRHLVSSSCAIGIALLLGATVESLRPALQFWWLSAALAAAGFAGGFLLIPVASFLQTRPAGRDKGRVLATANFCSFCAIVCSGIIFNILDSAMSPAQVMGTIALGAFATAFLLFAIRVLAQKGVRAVIAGVLRGILSLRYDIEIKGLDRIEKIGDRGTVFLPNHPALIDPVILMAILFEKFCPRSVSAEEQVNKPFVKQAVKLVDPILIPNLEKNGKRDKRRVIAALREMIKSLKKSEEIVMYPSGRLYRSCRENLGDNSGVEYILKHAPETRIILVRTTGLWGSSFSHARGIQPSLNAGVGRIIVYSLANMIFFGPRRTVTVELIENQTLKTLTSRNEINTYLEQFYNETARQNSHVPYYWWQGSVPCTRAEPPAIRAYQALRAVPATSRNHHQNQTDR